MIACRTLERSERADAMIACRTLERSERADAMIACRTHSLPARLGVRPYAEATLAMNVRRSAIDVFAAGEPAHRAARAIANWAVTSHQLFDVELLRLRPSVPMLQRPGAPGVGARRDHRSNHRWGPGVRGFPVAGDTTVGDGAPRASAVGEHALTVAPPSGGAGRAGFALHDARLILGREQDGNLAGCAARADVPMHGLRAGERKRCGRGVRGAR
jgi:hypothetical protein